MSAPAPPVRPDADPQNPAVRNINPFKAAFNLFLFGSSDPSYQDVGEARAQSIQSKALSDALLMAPPGDPARGQLVATMGMQGAQAAQAMRERYFAKEYKQMVSTQLMPLQEELHMAQEEWRSATRIINAPIPRTVPLEEAEMRNQALAASRPGTPEVVPQGKTIDGREKSPKIIDQPAPMDANPAAQPGVLSAAEYMPETMAFLDPVTGTPVEIASARGMAIESEATSRLMKVTKDVQLRMMDVLASYNGNPYAKSAIEKMIDGLAQQSGAATTGQVNPRDQIDWMTAHQQRMAATAQQTTQANQALLDLELKEANVHAVASDALALAQRDSAVAGLLGKNIAGKTIEELTPKQLQQAAAIGQMVREQARADQTILKSQGMQPLPPVMLDKPEKWEQHFDTSDPVFKNVERQEYAKIEGGIRQQVLRAANPDVSPEERAQILADAPDIVRTQIEAGMTASPEIDEYLAQKVAASDAYKDGRAKAFMESVSHYEDLQPGIRETVDATNARFIADAQANASRQGKVIPSRVLELWQTDRYGTFYRATSGRRAPDWQVRGTRPARATQDLSQLQADWQAQDAAAAQPGARSDVASQVAGEPPQARPEPRLGEQVLPPEADVPEVAEDIDFLEQDKAKAARGEQVISTKNIEPMSTPPEIMTQEQLGQTIAHLKKIQDKAWFEDKEVWTEIEKRLDALEEYHANIFERGVLGTVEYFKGRAERRAAEKAKRREEFMELLRSVPKVN